MPAAPKIRDAFGFVGRVEIQRKANAEEAGDADRHVGISREVEIELEGIGESADPCGYQADGVSRARGPKTLVGPRRDGVSNEDFFGQAHGEKRDPYTDIGGAVRRAALFAELRHRLALVDDGAGDDLWEKSREE